MKKYVDGVLVDLTAEEITARQAKEAARAAGADARAAEKHRITRNQLLAASDWTQMNDTPISGSKLTEWQTYRQSLRDITTQSNPFEVTWPTKPS